MEKDIIKLLRKWGIAAFVIFIILVGICIAWLSYNKVSTYTNDWGNLIDFLQSILTLFTLVVTIIIAVALKNVVDRNKKKSVITSYLPHLVAQQTSFYAYPGKLYGLQKPAEFTIEKKWVGYQSEKVAIAGLGVDIYNIGLGAAKTISCNFVYNIENAIELINDISKSFEKEKRIIVTLNRKKQKERHDTVTIDYPSFMEMSSLTLLLANEEIKKPHQLSVNISPDSFYLAFPHIYLELYTIYLYSWGARGLNKKSKEMKEFTPIDLTIKYSDIEMKNLESKFNFTLAIQYGSLSELKNELKVEEIFN